MPQDEKRTQAAPWGLPPPPGSCERRGRQDFGHLSDGSFASPALWLCDWWAMKGSNPRPPGCKQDRPAPQILNPWRLHDLRRIAASSKARIGQPVHVVEAVLGHRSGTIRGVAAVYNRYSYADEKRAALEAWAQFVLALIDERPASNVVALRPPTAAGSAPDGRAPE
jgi:hypothetical protein